MIDFFVAGVPVPKGSAKAFVNRRTGRAIVMQDNRDKQKPWSSMISVTAQNLISEPVRGPVRLSVLFVMPRPKSHFGTGKNASKLKDSAPTHHIVKPDLDKLVRCVKDALTGIAWGDDCQVCELKDVAKTYGTHPGAWISVENL